MNGFQAATKHGHSHTLTDVWITPQWIIDAIGVSDLDPCGWLPDGKPLVETASRYLTEEQDGLQTAWYGSVFCNFPYSQSKAWMKRCAEHGVAGNDVIVLCFARSDTKAWQENVKSSTGINLVNRRISFLGGDGSERTNGNAPSCLIAWGENAFQRIKNVDGIFLRTEP